MTVASARRLDAKAAAAAVSVAVFLGAVVAPAVLVPIIARSTAADDAICGGALDFVYAVGGLGTSWGRVCH